MSVAQGYRLHYKLNIDRSFLKHVWEKRLLFTKEKEEVLGKN